MNRINLCDARCQALQRNVPIAFAKDDKGGFEILAYTGAVVDRHWGKLAIALTGIKSRQSMPIFMQHDGGQIVGHSHKAWSDDTGFHVSGQFSQTTKYGQEARALAKEGFPWQASIGVKPLKVFEVRSGESTLCNAQQLTGPAEIWLESQVFEVSFVPLGADDKTSVEAFSESGHNTDIQTLAQAEWAADPALRSEFDSDFDGYLAYRENQDSVRFCGNGGSRGGNDTLDADPVIREEQLRATWRSSAVLREEFGDDFECYRSFKENEKFAKLYGGGVSTYTQEGF